MAAGTIAYELLCNVKRVSFVYQDSKAEAGLRSINNAKAEEELPA